MMTRSHCYWFSGIITIYFSLLFHSLASPTLHLCHHDQRDALLEFKDEFPMDKFKPSPWNKSSDCCFWEGVMCDDRSRQVISLNFTRTFLNSSLKTNSSLFKLQSLRHLILLDCHIQGEIPSSLGNLSRLTYVDLSYNNLVGEIPASIGNLNHLRYLSLGENNLTGEIPSSLGNLSRLTHVDLFYNKLVGEIPASICNLNKLEDLYLSHNNLIGEVPGCLWRLTSVSLNHNSFSSLEKISQNSSIEVLLLDSNSFRGPFAPWICKLKRLFRLDLSNNLFSGSIPSCLRNVIDTFVVLILRNNNFNGTLPDVFANATELQVLDVGGNQLEGNLPRSLINCKALEHVNVGSNKIKDTFPSWLGSLPSLNVLILRSNEFYGPLYHRNVSIGFQSLRIIDISHNGFTGTLPPHYFSSWREMTNLTTDWSEYMEGSFNATYGVLDSMEMVNKGVEMSFEHIRKDFTAIDFSGNRIYGKIPESVGFLKELRLLNLSGNAFTSDIPLLLANLTKLETLDLSRNKLSGKIPQDLGKLSFLSYMNFSHNCLQGPVPRGTQFQRQNCSSFSHNPGLYGLEDICGEKHAPNPASHQPQELLEAEEQMINWVAAAIAYGPGVFCGLVIGYIFTSHNHEWFTEKIGRRKHRVTTTSAR